MSRRAVVPPALVLALLAGTWTSGASAQAQPSAQSQPSPERLPEALSGTSWRLIEFRSPEDQIGTLRPADASLYTMSLAENGTVSMRLDCNRATGTWTASTAGGSFGFGPLRITRAVCQQPSLGAQIARNTEYVSSFLLRDGLLYLNLIADGGTYVWEPLRE